MNQELTRFHMAFVSLFELFESFLETQRLSLKQNIIELSKSYKLTFFVELQSKKAERCVGAHYRTVYMCVHSDAV